MPYEKKLAYQLLPSPVDDSRMLRDALVVTKTFQLYRLDPNDYERRQDPLMQVVDGYLMRVLGGPKAPPIC